MISEKNMGMVLSKSLLVHVIKCYFWTYIHELKGSNKSRKYNNLKWKNEQESKEEKTEFRKA